MSNARNVLAWWVGAATMIVCTILTMTGACLAFSDWMIRRHGVSSEVVFWRTVRRMRRQGRRVSPARAFRWTERERL